MKTVFLLAVRNTLRNSRRSALTAATVFFGCALLTIGLSWVVGIQGNFIAASVRANGHVRLVTQAHADREALQPIYENISQTDSLVTEIEAMDDVQAAFPRIQMGVMASVDGEEVGEVFGQIVGAPITYFDTVLSLEEKLIDGRFFSEGQAAQNEGLIGRSLARDMGVKAGEEAIFLGQTQDGSISPIRVTVVGVVDTGTGLFDKQVFVPLSKAQWMADIPEGAVEILIYGSNRRSSTRIISQLTPRLEAMAQRVNLIDIEGESTGLSISSWNTREPFASMLRIARIIMTTVAIIIVFITALGVLNTMLMSVLERTAEIGVLRSMGMKVGQVVFMFALEAIFIATIGGAMGVIVGSLGSIAMEASGVDLGSAVSNLPDTVPANRVLHPDWSPALSLIAFALGVVMAFIGSASPALRAARIQPVIAMRTRR